MTGRRHLVPVLLAAALLGSPAPAATAAVVTADCGYQTVAQEAVTGSADRFTGAAYGRAVFDDAATHTLRCYVTVAGAERATTPVGTGTGVVATAGQVTFDDDDSTAVAVCVEVDGVTTVCHEETPQCSDCGPSPDLFSLLLGVVDGAAATYVDPVVCPILASLSPGVPGVVDVTPAGDVTVAGVGGGWDCPPYGDG